MNDPHAALDSWIQGVTEMPDRELFDLLHLLERAYIHALIEAQLRGAPR